MSARRFEGYHELSSLPVKKGDTVTIRKGVMVRLCGVSKPAGRTYKVKVDHVLCGVSDYRLDGDKEVWDPKRDPSVRWPGTGGYWAEANINDVVEQ